jgi:hypothetical protein
MQGKKGAYGKAAAKRLLNLQRTGESDAEFATRLGLTSQHVYNYKEKGVSLDVLAQLHEAGKLSDSELLRVISERGESSAEPNVTLPPDPVLAGLRAWLDQVFPPATPSVVAPSSGAKRRKLLQQKENQKKGPRTPRKKRAGGDPGGS